MPELIAIFATKGDALAAIDQLYELGFGDTEIGFLDRPVAERAECMEQVRQAGIAGAVYAEGDETGAFYRDGIASGSAVLTVSVNGDETKAARTLAAAGALRVDAYEQDVGWTSLQT